MYSNCSTWFRAIVVHLSVLPKEMTKDIPVSFGLKTVAVNCPLSSCGHLFSKGKREDEEKRAS